MATRLETGSRPAVARSTFTILWIPPEALMACNPMDARTGSKDRISCSGTKTKRTVHHGRRERCASALGAYGAIVHEDLRVLPPAPPERSGRSFSIRTAR